MRNLKTAAFWGSCILGVIVLIKLVVLRLNNIDMTDMRYLVENWSLLLAFVVLLAIAFWTQEYNA